MATSSSSTQTPPPESRPTAAPSAPLPPQAGDRGGGDGGGGRRALVVGASSGIGAALVRQLAAEGWRVAALARRRGALEELAASCAGHPGAVLPHVHDVTHTAEVGELFETVVRELGGLDLSIYAAGIMPPVGRDEYDTEKDLSMLATNLAGCIAWCNETARLFGTQRHGTIVGISSIAGVRGRRGSPVYGTSKAAMDHYLEALRNRLAAVGVHVCTIKPGFVDTPMTAGLGLRGAISAERAAVSILSAARRRANTRYVPLRWLAVAAVVRAIPSFLFKRMEI